MFTLLQFVALTVGQIHVGALPNSSFHFLEIPPGYESLLLVARQPGCDSPVPTSVGHQQYADFGQSMVCPSQFSDFGDCPIPVDSYSSPQTDRECSLDVSIPRGRSVGRLGLCRGPLLHRSRSPIFLRHRFRSQESSPHWTYRNGCDSGGGLFPAVRQRCYQLHDGTRVCIPDR